MQRVALLLAALLVSPLVAAAEPQWMVAFGRATESADTDIVRLGYRHPLCAKRWRALHQSRSQRNALPVALAPRRNGRANGMRLRFAP